MTNPMQTPQNGETPKLVLIKIPGYVYYYGGEVSLKYKRPDGQWYEDTFFPGAYKDELSQAYQRGREEEKNELIRAKNFIKYLLYSRGGSITLMLDPSFEPEKFEIVRQSIVGSLAEVISLEELTKG